MCDIAGMKISTSKTKVLLPFKKSCLKCFMQVGGVSLKQVEQFRNLWFAFMSDERQNEELTGAIEKSKTLCV